LIQSCSDGEVHTNPDRAGSPFVCSASRRCSPGPVYLRALALALLLVSSATGQVLEGTILLPDSLGPLTGKTHVVFDENPDQSRMFIGSEDGDVLVLDAVTGRRIARIQSGPVASMCYSPQHNKLYTSTVEGYTVAVADCDSYKVTKELRFSEYVNGPLLQSGC